MTGALIILAVTVAFGLLLFYNDRRTRSRKEKGAPETVSETSDKKLEAESSRAESGHEENGHGGRGGICCGMHAVCEKLASPYKEEPDYFDDEELDRYAERPADAYTPEETDEFREVLSTMREEEVALWLESLERRRINLPDGLRDEVMLYLG